MIRMTAWALLAATLIALGGCEIEEGAPLGEPDEAASADTARGDGAEPRDPAVQQDQAAQPRPGQTAQRDELEQPEPEQTRQRDETAQPEPERETFRQ